jgi:NADP-dependent alcohol dehydrogenase
MNSGAVITKESSKEKLVFSHEKCFPNFSILDPSVVKSLPKRQIANGIVDAFVHTLEQYITDSKTSSPIQDGFSESILRTLISDGPKALNKPDDIESSSNFMFSATMALNGLIGSGVKQDWATHMIGHELTAFFGLDHAQTLAIVLPGVWEVMFEEKKSKLAQYGKNVWGLKGDTDSLAEQAIEKTEEFFQSLGVMTRINDYVTECYLVWEIPPRFKERGWKLGENQNIDYLKVEEILKSRL